MVRKSTTLKSLHKNAFYSVLPGVEGTELTYSGFSGAIAKLFELFGAAPEAYVAFSEFISKVWTVYSVIAFVISAILIYGIIYSYIRFNQFIKIEEEALIRQEELWQEMHGSNVVNRQWADVQQHIHSDNPNDWKLSIIEADVMLDHMLSEAGYAGTTIADKLRSAPQRSFQTIDDAWQAHRLRNQIAHGGADFVLTQKMAQQALIQYERVFREFGVV